MSVLLEQKGFKPWEKLAEFEAGLPVGSFGATASFVGTMRDFNEGDNVKSMTLEHYPGMTEKQLQEIMFSPPCVLRTAQQHSTPAGF